MVVDLLTLVALVGFLGGVMDAWNAQDPTLNTDIRATLARSAIVVVASALLLTPNGAATVVAKHLAGVVVGYVIGANADYEG